VRHYYRDIIPARYAFGICGVEMTLASPICLAVSFILEHSAFTWNRYYIGSIRSVILIISVVSDHEVSRKRRIVILAVGFFVLCLTFSTMRDYRLQNVLLNLTSRLPSSFRSFVRLLEIVENIQQVSSR